MITYAILSETLLSRLEPYGFCHVDGQPHSADDVACQQVIDQYQYEDAQKELIVSYTKAVQEYMESEAVNAGYDNLLSACSYAAVPNSFQAESISFTAWRSACWDKCHLILNQVNDGIIAAPSVSELLLMLPVRA